MFQTEPIIFLQSFRNIFITFFMRFISTFLGYEPFFVAICIIIFFGFNLRKGFILTQIILLSVIINAILKIFFALPRPMYVDTNVLRFYGNYPEFNLVSKGAKTFFGLIDKNIINFIRSFSQNSNFSYGFPSAHVMNTTALWASLSLLFKKKLLIIFTPIIIVLMALSRMYLGRHFLIDVLGGAIFGLIIVFIVYYIYIKFNLNEKLFNKEFYLFKEKMKNFILFLYLLIIPLFLIYFFPYEIGALLGINLSFYIILIKGLPDDQGTLFKRVLRVNIVFILFFLIFFMLKGLIKLCNINEDFFIIVFIESFIPIFLTNIIAYFIFLKTKLYKLENAK